MPFIRPAIWQLSLLMLAMPVQYLVSYVSVGDRAGQRLAFRRLLSYAEVFHREYLSVSMWGKWCKHMFQVLRARLASNFDDDIDGESPAVEVFEYRYNEKSSGETAGSLEEKGFFASSTDQRTHRPAEVKFHIGEVVIQNTYNYRGVIVGWDATAKAPEDWLKRNYPQDRQKWLSSPHYIILVDTRDRLTPQLAYVPQENIDVVQQSKVLHPNVEHFFEGFDGSQYIPRPWLQDIYPDD